LLDSGSYTLEQLLSEDELLQELRGMHPILLEYFSSPQAVTGLVQHVVATTVPPASDSSSSKRGPAPDSKKNDDPLETSSSAGIRFPYMACEVICCELSCVVDTIVDGYVVLEVEDDDFDADEEEGPSREGITRQQIIDSEHDTVEVVDRNSRGDSDESSPNSDISNINSGANIANAINTTSASSGKQGTRILDLLFSLVEQLPKDSSNKESYLDEYRAGYFEKVLRVLFRKRPDDMVKYVNDRGSELLPAFLRHLYSHSILQVVQRLLLPHRPTPKATTRTTHNAEGALGGDGVSAGDGNGRENPAHNSEERGSSIVLLEGCDGGAPRAASPGDVVDGDDDDENENHRGDPHAGEIRSDWSKRPEALEMLLDLLLLAEEDERAESGDNEANDDDLREQRRSDASLNAAEVLVTMIQNSLMSSAVMLTLTSSPVLKRLVVGASTLPPGRGKGDQTFSPHESPTTAAMSVLESLILQLGGYGPVGTMSMLDEAMMESSELVHDAQPGDVDGLDPELYRPQQQQKLDPNQPPLLSLSPDAPSSAGHVRFADLTSLLEHLPLLLDNLSTLLQHPDCDSWKCPTQFSRGVPVQQLGASRLRIVRVLESLVLLGDPDVDARLVQSDCLEVCLNLFWDFQWCSMLHQSVANLLVHVMEGHNARVEMQEYFLIRCNLLVRLMDSFVDPTSSAVSKSAPTKDHLSISDVDAAMERQQEADASTVTGVSDDDVFRATHTSGGSSMMDAIATSPPPQSFRYGYMGHVIIVCQALVHACSTQDDPSGAINGGVGGGEASMDASSSLHPRQVDAGEGADPLPEPGTSASALGSMIASGATVKQHPLESLSRGGDESTAFSKEPLYLAEMVSCHPLSEKWNHFISTTVAAETAIQSTPLGGFNVTAFTEGMQMHRPGLADDLDDSGLEPPSRLGDVLDMDDNDLEVAASMMAGMSVSGRARHLDEDDEESAGDSNRSYNSGETNNSGGGYLFDDPLGRINGGLGIELGKLTKYNPDTDNPDEVLKDEDDGDGSNGSQGSDHSSDEDEQDRRGSETDVPVIDLFAGNFDFVEPQAPASGEAAGQDWSDFANFDDAFAPQPSPVAGNVDAFAAFPESAAETSSASGAAKPSVNISAPSTSAELDAIFGTGDHASLLAIDDAVVEGEARKATSPDVEGTESSCLALVVPSVGSDLDAPSTPSDTDPAEDMEVLSAPSDELKADLFEPHDTTAPHGEER
jgi:hypothetical protein